MKNGIYINEKNIIVNCDNGKNVMKYIVIIINELYDMEVINKNEILMLCNELLGVFKNDRYKS